MNFTVLLQPAIVVTTAFWVLFYVFRAMRRHSTKPLVAAVIIAVGGLTVNATIVTVPPGHVGVIYSYLGGVQSHERPEGLTLVVPYIQSAYQMNVRTLKFFTPEAFAQSSDLQEITVHVTVNYNLDPLTAAQIFKDVGRDYEGVLIRPAVFEFTKEVVGLVKAENFASTRSEMASDILILLKDRFRPLGIDVTFVAIEDAVFQDQFILDIAAKVSAEVKAVEAKNLVKVAEHNAEAVVKTAAGEAEAILKVASAQAEANSVIAESLTSDLLIWQRVIDWNGELPETFIGNNDPLDLLFTVNP